MSQDYWSGSLIHPCILKSHLWKFIDSINWNFFLFCLIFIIFVKLSFRNSHLVLYLLRLLFNKISGLGSQVYFSLKGLELVKITSLRFADIRFFLWLRLALFEFLCVFILKMPCLPILAPFFLTDFNLFFLVEHKGSELKILVNCEFTYCIVM